MIRRLVISPGENFDEISLARFVHTLQYEMRLFRNQAETAIRRPCLGVHFCEFGFLARPHPESGNHRFRTGATKIARRHAETAAKQSAKRRQAFESGLEADFGYAKVSAAQQGSGAS